MVRARLGRDQVAVVGQQFRLGAGRYVQDVKAVSMSMRQVDRPPRGNHRRFHITNLRM